MKRFEIRGCIFNEILLDLKDNNLKASRLESVGGLVDLLNKQDEKIKQLELLLNGKDKMKTMSIKGVEKLKNENKNLKEQLSKAIVPKFEIGQECWYVFNRYQKEPIRCVIDRIYYDSDKNCKLRYDTSDIYFGGCREEHLFATQAEAEQKMKELEEKKDEVTK